jgi:hypothetical protein
MNNNELINIDEINKKEEERYKKLLEEKKSSEYEFLKTDTNVSNTEVSDRKTSSPSKKSKDSKTEDLFIKSDSQIKTASHNKKLKPAAVFKDKSSSGHKILNFNSSKKQKNLNITDSSDQFNITRLETSMDTYTMYSMLKPDDEPVIYNSKDDIKLNHRLI